MAVTKATFGLVGVHKQPLPETAVEARGTHGTSGTCWLLDLNDTTNLRSHPRREGSQALGRFAPPIRSASKKSIESRPKKMSILVSILVLSVLSYFILCVEGSHESEISWRCQNDTAMSGVSLALCPEIQILERFRSTGKS